MSDRVNIPAVRVRFIQIPRPRPGVIVPAIMAMGALVGWTAAYIGIMLAINWVLGLQFAEVTAVYFVAIAGALPVCALWIILVDRFRWRIYRRRRTRRVERLRRIDSHVDGPARLPHRCLEMASMKGPMTRRRVGRMLRSIAPGWLIIANAPADPYRPIASDTPFEPIDVSEDVEQATWLVVENVERQCVDIDSPPHAAKSEVRLSGKETIGLLFVLIGVASFAYLGYELWTDGLNVNTAIPAMLFAFMAVSLVFHLFAERRWWLVPGGLVVRERRAWRKRMTTRRFGPADSALFVDLSQEKCWLPDGRSVRCLPVPGIWSIALVTAWISRARRPSDDEIAAFTASAPAGSRERRSNETGR